MAITPEDAKKLQAAFGTPILAKVDYSGVPTVDKQQNLDPEALRSEWAKLPYEARDEMVANSYKMGGEYVLKAYPEDERGWQKFSGLKMDDAFVKNTPKYADTQLSQGVVIDRKAVEDQLKTERDFWKRAELETQLRQAPKDINPYDQIMNVENAIRTTDRLAQQKANEQANGVDYLVRMRANAPTEGPTNVFNEFYKGFARASQQAGGALFGSLEMFSENDPYLTWLNDYAQNQSDNIRSSILKTPELNRSSSTKNFMEGGAFDPNYYANVLGSLLPHVAGALTASVVGGVAGGPTGAVAGAGAYSYSMEAGSLYNDLLGQGYSMDESRAAAAKYGAIAAALDSVIPAKVGGAVANTFTQGLLRQGVKQSAKQTLGKMIKEFGKDVLIEASTEAAQEFAQNVTKSYFDKNQDIWENVIDSFVGGALGGGVFGAVGFGNQEVQNRTANVPDSMRNFEGENGYQGPVIPTQKVTPEVGQRLSSIENTSSASASAKKGFAQLEETENGISASIRLAELMKSKDPSDTVVQKIQEQAQQELDNVKIQKQILAKQYEEGTNVDVVASPEFTMSVGETIDGKFISYAYLMLENGTEALNNTTKYETRADAELGMTQLVQEYVGDKLSTEDISHTDIQKLQSVNAKLLDFVQKPNPQRMIRENRDVMLLAQDMKKFSTFEKAVRKNNLLPENTDIAQFYERARSAEGNYITAREARSVVEKYAGDMGVSTEFVQKLITPEGKRALGSFMRDERVIKIVTRARESSPDVEITTPYHEVGHAYFQTMMTPEERANVLQEIKNNSKKELTDKEAEEVLVEDLRAYNDKKTLKALKKRIQPAYARLLDSIKEIVDKVLKWIGRSSEDKINQFYEDVLSMKRPSEKVAMDIEKQQEVYRETAQAKAELVVLHNTTIENLKKSVELGGLPVPSLAITKGSIPFTEFGDITLVGGSSIIDPSLDSRNKVFSVDAYTPRAPKEKYEINTKLAASLYDNIYRDIPNDVLGNGSDALFSYLFSGTNSLEDLQILSWESVPVLYAYIKSKGISPDIVYKNELEQILASDKKDLRKTLLENKEELDKIPSSYSYDDLQVGGSVFAIMDPIIKKFLNDLDDTVLRDNFKEYYYNENGGLSFGKFDSIIYNAKNIARSETEIDTYSSKVKLQDQVKREDLNQWVEDKFGKIFGKKYFQKGNRNIDYTFENVIAEMSGRTVAQEMAIFDSGFGKLQAYSSKKLANMKQIQSTKERLVTKEEGEAEYERLQQEYSDLGMDMEYKYQGAGFFERMESLISAFKKYFKGGKTIENLGYALRSQDFTPSQEMLQRAYTFAEEVMNIPMSYMEAKPQRGVYLSEFSGVVVPQEQYEQVRDVLRGTDLYNQVYTYRSEEERTAMVEKVAEDENISFRESTSSLEEEALKYDTVEEFIKAQGESLYHGTNSQFDKFNSDSFKNGWLGKGAYLTPNKAYAKQNGKILKEVVVSTKNTFVVQGDNPSDIISEIKSKFPNERTTEFNISEVLKKKGYDSIRYKHWDDEIGEMVAIFNPEAIKTKQQLTDIYNKAHGESFRENNTEDTAWSIPEKEEVKKSVDDAMYEIGAEMDIAEAGKRWSVASFENGFQGTETIAANSSFPKWFMDENKSRPLLDRAAEYLDGQFRIPPAHMTRLRSAVLDMYTEVARRSKEVDIEAIRKAFDTPQVRAKKSTARLQYKKFATPITAEDLQMVQDIFDNSTKHSEVYSEEEAKNTIAFLADAYQKERELLSRTGSPFPEEVATRLRDVEEYARAGIEDTIKAETAKIIKDTTNVDIVALIPNNIVKKSKNIDDMVAQANEYNADLGSQLIAMDRAELEKLYRTAKNSSQATDAISRLETVQSRLDKKIQKETARNEAIVARLTDARIKMVQLQEARAYKDAQRNSVRNVARMINLVDRKRIKDLENEVRMSDKQYLKDMYKAQAKGANAASLETARIIKQKLRETRKHKELLGKIESLRSRVKASVKTGGRYYVDFARKLLAVFDEYDTSSLSNRSMEKLQDIYDMMYNNEKISDEMKEWYKNNIDRVSKKSLREMSYDELNDLYSTLSALANKGAFELAQVQYFSEEEKQRRIMLAIESTRNMDGEGRTGTTRDALSKGAVKEALIRTGLDVLTPVAVMDKFDGNKNFTGWNAMQIKSLQKGEQKWYAQLHGATEELKTRVQEIKATFTPTEEKFLSLVARSREEADGAVRNLLAQLGVSDGIIPAQVEGLTLDQAEQIIDIIEEISDKYEITTQLKTIFESRTNKPFPTKKHYVAPLKYTNRVTDTTDADLEALQNFADYGTEVGEGMAISRMEKVDLEVRTDLLTLVTEGWNHSLYYINMQPRVDNIQSVVGSKEFKTNAGRIVSTYWKEYLSQVANKGKSMGQGTFDVILRNLRQNFQVAILGFKVSTILTQPTAGFNAAMTAYAMHGTDFALSIMGELAQAYIVPSYTQDALSQSEALTIRAGSAGSTDFAEINKLMETGFADVRGNYGKLKAGAIKAGMYMIQEVDIRTAAAVWNGMYKKFIDKGMSETKARAEADFFMSLSQSSTQLVDRPLILSRYGEIGRLVFTFQTFTLGLWSMITQGLVVNGIIKGTPKVKIKSAIALLAIPFFTAFAGEMISTVTNAIKGKDDDKDLEDKLATALENTWVELVATVPLFGSIIKGQVLYNRGYTVPVLGTGVDLIAGVQGMMTAKDYDAFMKSLVDAGKASAIVAGIPGAYQASDIINRLLTTEKEKKQIETRAAARAYMDAKETNIDKYVTELIIKTHTPEEIKKLKASQKSALRTAILKEVVRLGDNEEAKTVLKLTKNEDKVNYLKEIRDQYSLEDFKKLVRYLKKYKVLSDEAELLLYKK